MASSSANPLAAELTADEIATRDAEAVVKYDEGVALIKENKIDDAVQLFYELLETQTSLHGELALEVAPIYFKYGSCLFYKAQDEADILGDQGQSAASKRDTGNDALEGGSSTKEEKTEGALRIEDAAASDATAAAAAAAPEPVDNGKGKAPMPAPEEEDEEQGAAAPGGAGEAADDDDDGPAEEEEEEKTDMELAWENLETARHIYESNLDSMTSDQKLMFAEVYERLADLSMEKEDFETCVNDFKSALAIFQALLPANDRREASLHFKMALALQFMDEPEDGLAHCQQALGMMESKLDELKSLVPEGEGDSEAAEGATEDIKGVLEDLRDKEVELKEVIAQNNSTKEAIKNAFAQFAGGLGGFGGADAAPSAVQDLGVVGGNSGRNRVTPAAAAPAAEPKAEAENKENDASNTAAPAAPADQPAKAKKRSLEDLMGGGGGDTTIGFGGAES